MTNPSPLGESSGRHQPCRLCHNGKTIAGARRSTQAKATAKDSKHGLSLHGRILKCQPAEPVISMSQLSKMDGRADPAPGAA